MIWINIVYTIKQVIIYIMSLILLNALTGSCIFICFKLLEKPLEKMGLIKMSVRLLRVVILSFLIPVVFVLLFRVYDDNVTFSIDYPLPYVFGCFLLIWAVGWGKAFVHSIQIHKRLKYLINTACLCEKDVIKVKDEWQKKLRIHQNVIVKQTYTIATPIICGIIKPVILLPVKDYSKEELDVIFAHELMHCRHKDILWKQLCAFSRIVFWWNPLIQRFVFDVDSWNESYCDQAVTKILKNKKEYFTTICRLGIKPFEKGAYLCATLYEDKNQLKTRIYRIRAIESMNIIKIFAGLCMGTLLFVTSMFAVIFITRGYHDIYMRTVITVSDLREKYMDPEPIAEVTDVEKLEVHDEVRLAKKLPVVRMKERITRKKDDLVFVQKLKAGTRMESNSVYLKKGETVEIGNANSKDENTKNDSKFVSGIIDDQGKEWYAMNSMDIDCSIKIQKAGNYRVFVENRYKTKVKVFMFTYLDNKK